MLHILSFTEYFICTCVSISSQTVGEGKKIDYTLAVKGATPIKVAWYRDGTKLKSSRNSKVSFLRGEAKMQIFEATGDDGGIYKVEAINDFGEATLTAEVSVLGR